MSFCEESLLMYTAIEHGSLLSLSLISLPHLSLSLTLFFFTAKTPARGTQASMAKPPAQGSQASSSQALLLKAGRPPWSHISPSLCSPPDHRLCRPNSMNGQANYLVCNSSGYTCALKARPFLLFLIGEY